MHVIYFCDFRGIVRVQQKGFHSFTYLHRIKITLLITQRI